MLTSLVKPGDRVDLCAVERTLIQAPDERKYYGSKVYDIISEDKLEILMPIEQSKLILLPVDAEYDLCFYTQGGLYQCYARVVDRYKDNSVYVLLLELTTSIRKKQRREYYRYSCVIPMMGRELVEEEITALEVKRPYLEEGLPTRESTIVDLSGGGMRFVGRHKYEKGIYVYVKCKLVNKGKEKVYELIGRILTVEKIENRSDEYDHRLQFIQMGNRTREEIIRYIFEEERKNRKREKG